MRICAWTWPFPFGVRLGWATTRVPNPQNPIGRVYLLRGQAMIFSRGFGAIADRLRQAGWWTEDVRCVGDRWMRRHLIADAKAGRLHGPVVMVGHSCGGRYALYSAQQLAPSGIRIDLLICVDVAWPYDVAGNVAHALHIFRAGPRIYPARPLCHAPGSMARITNRTLSGGGVNHLNITASAEVQEWIVQTILEMTIGRQESGDSSRKLLAGKPLDVD